jgi:hypothetical protein
LLPSFDTSTKTFPFALFFFLPFKTFACITGEEQLRRTVRALAGRLLMEEENGGLTVCLAAESYVHELMIPLP